MSVWMQKNGWKTIAEILTGACGKLDGMYAECSADELSAGERSHEWYALHKDSVIPVRLHIAESHVDADNKIHFTAFMRESDVPSDADENTCVRCITLVSLGKHGMHEDRLICTMDLTTPIKLAEDAYVVLHAGMKLGDIK